MFTKKLPDHMGPLIKILNTIIETRMNAAAAELGLTGTQTHILHFLCIAGEDITQHKLEKLFNLNHATLSGIISRLESKGFVETLVCDSDRRVKIICPTQKARDCDEIMHNHIMQVESDLLTGIDENEKELLRSGLLKMIDNINNIKNRQEDNKC